MFKTSALILTLLSSFLYTSNAEALVEDRTYTITCEFDDGLGWQVTVDGQHWAYYYWGYCQGQGGTNTN